MKEEITRCAKDIYLEEGYNGFSMRKVAACVGISATAIYRHFPDKEALLFNVLLTGFRLFASYLRRSENETTARARLTRSIAEYLNFALENPGYYEIMFMTSDKITGLKNLNQRGAEEMQATYVYHHQLVVNCAFKEQNNDELAATIWAFVHGLVALYLVGKLPLDRDHFVALYKRQTENFLAKL